MFMVDQVLCGRYKVTGSIRDGGMAEVVKAVDLETGNNVAIKSLRTGTETRTLLTLFQREGEIHRTLRHPNILPMLDYGEWESNGGRNPFFVFKYVEGGRTLQDVIDSHKTKHHGERKMLGSMVPLAKLLRLMAGAVAGMSHAHSHGIVHRDFKPSNVLVEEDSEGRETALVMDFGISRAYYGGKGATFTRLGMVLGTPEYMSPQQFVDVRPGDDDYLRYDPRNDSYAVGAVLYEMVTGELPYPFREENRIDVMRQIAQGQLRPEPIGKYCVDIPDGLVNLIMLCLQFDLEARPLMHEIHETLEALRLNVSIRPPHLLAVDPIRGSDPHADTLVASVDPVSKRPSPAPTVRETPRRPSNLSVKGKRDSDPSAREPLPLPAAEPAKRQSHGPFVAFLFLLIAAVIGVTARYWYPSAEQALAPSPTLGSTGSAAIDRGSALASSSSPAIVVEPAATSIEVIPMVEPPASRPAAAKSAKPRGNGYVQPPRELLEREGLMPSAP